MVERHNVHPEEVEEVCHGKHVIREGYAGRIILVGFTAKGRALSIVLDPETEPGVYYPVTARPASRKERQLYETEHKEGGEDAA